MFATTHINSNANPSDTTWLVTRAVFWSDAENSVMSPMPTIAIAAAMR